MDDDTAEEDLSSTLQQLNTPASANNEPADNLPASAEGTSTHASAEGLSSDLLQVIALVKIYTYWS